MPKYWRKQIFSLGRFPEVSNFFLLLIFHLFPQICPENLTLFGNIDLNQRYLKICHVCIYIYIQFLIIIKQLKDLALAQNTS